MLAATRYWMYMKSEKKDISAAATDSLNARRRFLRSAVAIGAGVSLSGISQLQAGVSGAASGRVPLLEAKPASPLRGELAKMERNSMRRLHLMNEHTGDDLDLVYYLNGIFINDNLSKLNFLMRDRRANIATQMDTTLYDILYSVKTVLGTDEPVHVLSGYRTPETNARLRKRSKRVAKFSLHMEGRAADIYIPGFSVRQVHEAAMSLKAGGVGLYAKSNFVHIDTGNVRYWQR